MSVLTFAAATRRLVVTYVIQQIEPRISIHTSTERPLEPDAHLRLRLWQGKQLVVKRDFLARLGFVAGCTSDVFCTFSPAPCSPDEEVALLFMLAAVYRLLLLRWTDCGGPQLKQTHASFLETCGFVGLRSGGGKLAGQTCSSVIRKAKCSITIAPAGKWGLMTGKRKHEVV